VRGRGKAEEGWRLIAKDSRWDGPAEREEGLSYLSEF
jgi:hypothetical protein